MTSTESAWTPLISVVVATRNRAEMLRDSLHSVLCQTYPHIEVIVVDDGSEDDTRAVVESMGDPRLRYLRQEHAGISAARNCGTDQARGEWIAVHDDDDIMLPSRLADQLGHVDGSVDFIFGAFVNFDDVTGELQLHHGRNYGYGPALMSGFAPGHSTWLVRTAVMRRFPYDEGIESAVDNNLVFRMLRSGVRFRHSGVICLLRRVHSGRITSTGGAGQKYVAGMNLAFIARGVPPEERELLVKDARRDWGPVDKDDWQARQLPYLPDHLVRRSGYMVTRTTDPTGSGGGSIPTIRLDVTPVERMSWREFFTACSHGASGGSVIARPRESEEIERIIAAADLAPTLDGPDVPREALATLFELAASDATAQYFAVVEKGDAGWTAEQSGLLSALCIAHNGTQEIALGIVPLRSWNAATALRDSVFRDAGGVRIFSAKPYAEIVAMLGSPS